MKARFYHRGMKTRLYLIGMSLAAIVFLSSLSGLAYAAWVVEDDTDAHVSTTSLSIDIITDTTAHDPQYPGADITRDVSVHNSGNAPVFVRIKTVNSFVNAAGDVIPDTTGLITVVYDATAWKDGEDGYLYLRGVLAPGETSVSCIESVTLSPAIDSDFAGYTATVTPQAEALQITSSAVMAVWKKSYEFMEAQSPKPREAQNTSIIFMNPQTGFAFIPNTKDIYPGAKDLTPGEVITSLVTLANAYDEAVEIHVSSGLFVPSENTELFSKHATLAITNEAGEVIFRGPAAGPEWDAFTTSVVLKSDTTTTWEVNLTIQSSAPNDLQGIETNILSWDLRAEEPGDNPPTPGPSPTPKPEGGWVPSTGENSVLLMCALMAAISGTVLCVLARKYRNYIKGAKES